MTSLRRLCRWPLSPAVKGLDCSAILLSSLTECVDATHVSECRARRIPTVAAALAAFALVGACSGSSPHEGPIDSSSHVPTASRPAAPSFASSQQTPPPVVAPALAPAAQSPGLTRPADAEGPYRITDVVDGDTDRISVNGRSVKLRLIGIDTPETKHPSKPVQCFGEQASARAEQLLTGKTVWIEYDASQSRRDVYGRDLVYVWMDSHTMFNEVMVAEGYAHEYTYDQPYRYQQQFRAAESKAHTAGLGLWSRKTCGGNTEQAAAGAVGDAPYVAPRTATPTPTYSDGQLYYSSCSKVRAAGKAPLMRGQPGYRAGLDGDHNGVACQ
jgi:endonuclease YncB( thermonuclease family)